MHVPATEPAIDNLAEKATPSDRRLNLIVPDSTYREINALSRETRRTISDLVRFGLALVRIAIRETRDGNRIVVKKPTGEEKEILIPS